MAVVLGTLLGLPGCEDPQAPFEENVPSTRAQQVLVRNASGPATLVGLLRIDNSHPLGKDEANECTGWISADNAELTERGAVIRISPDDESGSDCSNVIRGSGGEVVSDPATSYRNGWFSARVKLDDAEGTRYAFFMFNPTSTDDLERCVSNRPPPANEPLNCNQDEITIEIDRVNDTWQFRLITFRLFEQSANPVATAEVVESLPRFQVPSWHTLTLHRTNASVTAYLDREVVGTIWHQGHTCERSKEEGCLPRGDVLLYANAWAPSKGLFNEEPPLPGEAVYDIAWISAGTGPVADFRVRPSPSAVGQPTTLDASTSAATGEKRIVLYRWSFPDGSERLALSPAISHQFAEPGLHQVMLQVTDSDNNTDTYIRTVSVIDPELEGCSTPAADPMPVPTNLENPDTAFFGTPFVATWDHVWTGCGGYEFEYRRAATNTWISTDVASGNQVSITIALPGGTVNDPTSYELRVRSYWGTDNDTKQYSDYSASSNIEMKVP